MYTWCKDFAKDFSCRGALLDLPEVGLEAILPGLGAHSLQLALDADLGGQVVDPQDVGVRGEFIPVGTAGVGEGLTLERSASYVVLSPSIQAQSLTINYEGIAAPTGVPCELLLQIV